VPDEADGRKRIVLRDLENGELYPISQDLGPGSVACNLDAGELALACGAVERAGRARRRPDRIEQIRQAGGLARRIERPFRCAMVAKAPVIASVSPDFLEEWARLRGASFRFA